MQTVYHCAPGDFCCSQKETGGAGTPLEIWCMANPCQYPGKQCLYVKLGGKRPQDGE